MGERGGHRIGPVVIDMNTRREHEVESIEKHDPPLNDGPAAVDDRRRVAAGVVRMANRR